MHENRRVICSVRAWTWSSCRKEKFDLLLAGIATNMVFRAVISVCSRLDGQADQVTGGSTAGEAWGHLEGLEEHPHSSFWSPRSIGSVFDHYYLSLSLCPPSLSPSPPTLSLFLSLPASLSLPPSSFPQSPPSTLSLGINCGLKTLSCGCSEQLR